MYTYEAKLVRVVDGDTAEFDVSLGFYVSVRLMVRFRGINTPELRGGTDESKAKARDAKIYVQSCLEHAKKIVLRTYKDKTGKFGRWIADVMYEIHAGEDLVLLNEELVARGLAEKVDY